MGPGREGVPLRHRRRRTHARGAVRRSRPAARLPLHVRPELPGPLSGGNPVRFLTDLWPSTQAAAERNPELMARVQTLVSRVAADLARPDQPRPGVDGPVAFFCSEFGVHASLPIYSGGLGVLAG